MPQRNRIWNFLGEIYLVYINAYTHNGTIYLSGQFGRDDAYEGQEPYSLLLYSQDGKTFSIDRFTLVSDIGYRFLSKVGSDNNLYLGNCNRVCYSPVTWVFDGVNGTNALELDISGDDIKSISDTDLTSCSISLRSGQEEYYDSTYLVEGARVILYLSLETSTGTEEVKYATYILDKKQQRVAAGQRGQNLALVGEGMWKLSGLTMPFYAELLGKSGLYNLRL